MEAILRHVDGPVDIAAAGTHEFWYTHPEKTPPVMVTLVGAQLETGTAGWCELYLVRGQQYMRIQKDQLTADYPFMSWTGQVVLETGDQIKCRIRGLAAADKAEWTVRGVYKW